MADSTGAQLDLWQDAYRALVLGRVLARTWGPADHVGLLVPPTVPAAVANLAVSLWGKVPVNLNYSASQSLVDSSIDQCGITHVLTSAKVLDEFKITPKGQLDPARGHPASRCGSPTSSGRRPSPSWCRSGLWAPSCPGLRGDHLDATATVIFTSGSTGDPKGVVLSHRNVLSNVHQIEEQVHLKPDEVLLGILPFFHSFGFTVTIWTAHLPGQEGGLSLQPARCPDDRQALRGAQGDAADGHALVHAVLPEELRAAAVPDAHALDPGGREAQARAGPRDPSRRSASSRWRATAAPSSRRSWR